MSVSNLAWQTADCATEVICHLQFVLRYGAHTYSTEFTCRNLGSCIDAVGRPIGTDKCYNHHITTSPQSVN
ncbi:uncharacterized protein UV8b_05305 [Ustilaginoidea virens]|uniref:Uncharacterized protein n=1 Tax=Ustilaginoidea virens TaxID=1159556 RepID=A0A8E5MII6_USTVR|nr:uncharacterized protein UV8b_05305 [Ustilaginoidea virens]QUC21062.1 hypothetical protein UV8b_05305 [Ustilaginoidea virens]